MMDSLKRETNPSDMEKQTQFLALSEKLKEFENPNMKMLA